MADAHIRHTCGSKAALPPHVDGCPACEEMAARIRAQVAAWPPLTPEQRDVLALLLAPAVASVAARRASEDEGGVDVDDEYIY